MLYHMTSVCVFEMHALAIEITIESGLACTLFNTADP